MFQSAQCGEHKKRQADPRSVPAKVGREGDGLILEFPLQGTVKGKEGWKAKVVEFWTEISDSEDVSSPVSKGETKGVGIGRQFGTGG